MSGEYPVCYNFGRKLLEPNGLRTTLVLKGDNLGARFYQWSSGDISRILVTQQQRTATSLMGSA